MSKGVLAVSDSRAAGWDPVLVAGWSVRLIVKPGAKLPILTEAAYLNCDDHIQLIIMVALHCDLTYLIAYVPERRKGLMKLHLNLDLGELVSHIRDRQ